MKSFEAEVTVALAAKSEDEMESAGSLFEEFIELMQEEDFDDFESFFKLANFLIEDYWPESGMFAEISSQLFTEYEIGGIDWIWENHLFMDYCIKFLDSDIHFGCFVLTEGRSNALFTSKFAERALNDSCDICTEMGDGWLSPEAYVCEEPTSSVEILKQFAEQAFELFKGLDDEDKYQAVVMMRSLAGNSNTPRDILERLSQINESSIGHEIRNINGGMEPEDAIKDSFVDFKARETL
jgi:hypothetical protein